METKNFDIIITGVGGQGIITLISLIDEAAFVEGYDVKSSELHGLSQRGGSVEAHIRMGEKIQSPLVGNGKANLIMSLELLEGLRETAKAGKNTKFLINKYSLAFQGGLSQEEILKNLPKENIYLVPASDICKEKLQKEIVSSVYLLGYGVYNKIIPIKPESVLKAIENTIPEKYRELNINAFNLAKPV